MNPRVGLLLAVSIVGPALCQAQDFKGAREAVKEIIAAPKDATDATAAIESDLKKFSSSYRTMSPDVAGKNWVSLLQAAYKYDNSGEASYYGGSTTSKALATMPGPTTWPYIRQAVRTAPDGTLAPQVKSYLVLLTAILLGDRPTQASVFDGLIKKIDLSDEGSISRNSSSISAYHEWAKSTGDLAALKRSLMLSYGGQNLLESTLSPDIMLLPPTDRDAIAKLYFSNDQSTGETYEGDDAFKAFVRSAAVKYGKANSASIWRSLASLGPTTPFVDYCRANKKFIRLLDTNALDPTTYTAMRGGGYEGMAVGYYVINLILEGKAAAAEKIMLSAPPSFGSDYIDSVDLSDLKSVKPIETVAESLARVLSQNPNSSFWKTFKDDCLHASRGDLLVATAEKAAKNSDVTGQYRSDLEDALANGYLAIDRVEDAINLFIAALPTGPSTDPNDYQSLAEPTQQLLNLGSVLNRNDLIDRAIKAVDSSHSQYASYMDFSIGQALEKVGRNGEAEARYIRVLVSGAKNEYGGYNGGDNTLEALAKLYSKAGRYDDVLYLLRNAPGWQYTDLSQAISSNGVDIAYVAAKALAATGDNETALRLVKAALPKDLGNDRGYELLLKLDGDDTVNELDYLSSLDQFEERPLIWKAKVLYDKGDYKEAEKIARQAIAIDPSDGEEGKGDRMRVYGVLSDILRKLGDDSQADIYANAVRAIRLSENADDYINAGMLARGIKMYEQSLNIFADAYCIQSRLAVQLVEAGHPDEAADHYRKAFELMPDSFGRIESHCFGCEHVFESQEAQDIALNVLNQLLKERPNKPQVPYLMGYLLQSRGQEKEAATYFEKAVTLDPKYFNAWVQLRSAYRSIGAPSKDIERASLAILSLDPLGRHSSTSGTGINDYAKLWAIGERMAAGRKEIDPNLFELTASKRKLESQPSQYQYAVTIRGYPSEPGPASILMENSLISAIQNILMPQGGGIY